MSINEVVGLKIQMHKYFMKNQSLATKDYIKFKFWKGIAIKVRIWLTLSMLFLNKALVCFLEIPFVCALVCVFVCLCVCVSALRALITSGKIWCDIGRAQLVKQVSWLFLAFNYFIWHFTVDKMDGRGLINTACHERLPKKTKVMRY